MDRNGPPPRLDPIRWTRLENERPRRPRGRGGPRIPAPADRAGHGFQLAEAAEESIRLIGAKRDELGVDPGRLLVLRLTFLANDLLELLEKIGAFVVEERAEHPGHGNPNIYRVVAQFVSPDAIHRFTTELQMYRDRIVLLTSLPLWLGDILRTVGATPRNDLAQALGVDYAYQFPSNQAIEAFEQTVGSVDNRTRFSRVQSTLFLTLAERRDFGHALQSVGHLAPVDRMGARLRTEGIPEQEPFFLDVDLWHPGEYDAATAVLEELERVAAAFGGQVTDRQRTQSMLLARVRGNRRLLSAVLELSIVSRVDLKPRLPLEPFDIMQPIDVPDLPPAPENGPLAAVIDSGVVPGHDLLAGWVVDTVDFDSGDDTGVDQAGHGTQVAGIVVYGDVAEALRTNRWTPRVKICSGKVLNRQAEFSDTKRAETQIREAIEYFVREYDCRVFNLSIGNGDNVFDGAHQLPWAHMLDELTQRHRLVVVVAIGNVPDPEIPPAANEEQFRSGIRDQLLSDSHRLIDPATAALALTVGSIARRDDPAPLGAPREGDRPRVVGSVRGLPSPFTRSGLDYGQPGTGISKQIKPDLVAQGGNYCLLFPGGTRWVKQDRNLGEPTLKFDGGRVVTAVCGTSFAAPHVTHAAAILEHRLRERHFPDQHRANSVRALLVHAARVGADVEEWLTSGFTEAVGERRLMRLVGHGLTDEHRASYSDENRAVLIANDVIPVDQVHVYELYVPRSFLNERGKRTLRVTLAYDPPTRATRKEYLARTMWFQVIRGLDATQVFEFMSRADAPGDQPRIPSGNLLQCRPSYTSLQWSTTQSASFESPQAGAFNHPVNDEVLLHILVGCQRRFDVAGEGEEPTQNYTLVASLEHSAQGIRLHQQINQRLVERIRVRRRG